MTRTKIAGLCGVLVLALAGATCAAASARPVWKIGIGCKSVTNGHWMGQISAICVIPWSPVPVYKYEYGTERFISAGEPQAVSGTFTEGLTDEGTGIGISCHGTEKGKLKAEGLDEQTEMTFSECHVVKGTCGTPSVTAVHLPWKTELYEASEKIRDRVESGGSGNPGWTMTCTVLGIKVMDTCTGSTNTAVENADEGDVDEVFDSSSTKENCAVGGNEKGVMEGTGVVDHLSSTEAVFVE